MGILTTLPEIMRVLARRIDNEGGRAFVVGGYVRDLLLNRPSKDIDVEVHGLPADALHRICASLGDVDVVGRSFGVLKLRVADEVIDVSMPRRDSKNGEGHKGFTVGVDPDMGIEEACRRRDFTMNAIMVDVLDNTIVDPFHGVEDLGAGVLRMVDKATFGEDPLRVLRAMQFLGRFNLTIDTATLAECSRIARPGALRELPEERLQEEWKKLLLSENPGKGIRFAYNAGILQSLHPELAACAGVPQPAEWHPEGDVLTHMELACTTASIIMRREQLSPTQQWTLGLAALCHDLGKPAATKVLNETIITAHGHDKAGMRPALAFLRTINVDNNTTVKVLRLVEHHMRGWEATRNGAQPGAYRRLARDLAPALPEELVWLMEADGMGMRAGEVEQFTVAMAHALTSLSVTPAPIIRGADLITLGMEPGPRFSLIIRKATELHDRTEIGREAILAAIAKDQGAFLL